MGWRSVAALLIAGVLLFCSPPGYADAREPIEHPGLMVLFDANTDEDGEPKFVTEVALAIDQYEVIPVRLEDGNFRSRPFESQRETLRALAREHRAGYSIWVVFAPSGSATLFMCTLLPQRTFLWTVDVPSGPDVEKDLAAAARELLEEINLTISLPPASRPAKTEQPVFHSFFDIMLSARGTFGIVGQEGPSVLPGVGIGLKWWSTRSLYLKMEMALDFGPYEKTDIAISGITVAPGLGIGYSKKWVPVSVGPLFEFQESWTRLKMTAPDVKPQVYDWWHFRVAAGLSLGIAIKKSTIAVDATVGLSPVRDTIRRQSDSAVRLVTPLVDFRVALCFLFPAG